MSDDDFARVGELLRGDMGEMATPSHHASERARLVAAAAERSVSRLRRAAVPLALAAAAVVAVLLLLTPREAPPLGFVVGPKAQVGQEGAFYAAPPTGAFELRFEDGTTVALQRGSGVRISRARQDESVVLLERGSTRFDVVHDPARTWRVAAGAYAIFVTGTSFTVDWQSEREELTVQMHEGQVTITGPGLDGGVSVGAGERFVSRVSRGVGEDVPEAPEATPPEPAEPSEERETITEPPAPEPPPTPVTSAKPRPKVPTGALWPSMVVEGKHDEVLAAADARGVDDVLRSANSSDLRALADAARYRGRGALAERALVALRTRFPGTARATAAAFLLGRMRDEGGDAAQALRWYDAYLAEGGPLAPDAKGRKMIALHELGRLAEARRLAREYLDLYPNGAYAKHARDIAR